ncbi:MAG: hypothetical protein KAS93_07055 [Gammaproteobacteria bacterium]|nr:hypothetical protein [Gammaproteobacteria bacterium]
MRQIFSLRAILTRFLFIYLVTFLGLIVAFGLMQINGSAITLLPNVGALTLATFAAYKKFQKIHHRCFYFSEYKTFCWGIIWTSFLCQLSLALLIVSYGALLDPTYLLLMLIATVIGFVLQAGFVWLIARFIVLGATRENYHFVPHDTLIQHST